MTEDNPVLLAAAVLAYFIAVCLVLVLMLHSTGRRRVFGAIGRSGIPLKSHSRRFVARTFEGLKECSCRAGALVTSPLRMLLEARTRLGLAAMLTAVPPLVVLALPQTSEFHLDDRPLADSRISALLAGERLTPPRAPPPDVFVTAEAELVGPYLASASRDWDLLDAQFGQRLLTVFALMKERHGYELVLMEGYRSPERQAELAARGPSVTKAGPNMSYHQYGLAADVAFLKNGKLLISERDPWAMRGYRLYGELAEAAGLTWGGRWQMMDFGHVELPRPNLLRKTPT